MNRRRTIEGLISYTCISDGKNCFYLTVTLKTIPILVIIHIPVIFPRERIFPPWKEREKLSFRVGERNFRAAMKENTLKKELIWGEVCAATFSGPLHSPSSLNLRGVSKHSRREFLCLQTRVQDLAVGSNNTQENMWASEEGYRPKFKE